MYGMSEETIDGSGMVNMGEPALVYDDGMDGNPKYRVNFGPSESIPLADGYEETSRLERYSPSRLGTPDAQGGSFLASPGSPLLYRGKCHEDVRGAHMKWLALPQGAAGFPVFEAFMTVTRGELTGRGLHFQQDPQVGKLVSCVGGSVFVVVVDLCPGHVDTFGKPRYAVMSVTDTVWVPRTYAFGYMSIRADLEARMVYLVDGPWNPDMDGGVRWDDPAIAARWPDGGYGPGAGKFSDRDMALPGLGDFMRETGGRGLEQNPD